MESARYETEFSEIINTRLKHAFSKLLTNHLVLLKNVSDRP